MIGQNAPSNSRLRLLFGQYPQNLKGKVSGIVTVDPAKASQTRNGYKQFLGVDLPQQSLVLQLTPRNGNAKQLTDKLNEIQKLGDTDAQINAYVGGNNKVYVNISSMDLTSFLLEIDNKTNPADCIGKNSNEIMIQLLTETDLDKLTKSGINLFDYYKSLLIDIQLIKTKALNGLLRTIMEMMVPNHLWKSMGTGIDRFDHINLDLRFSSADIAPLQLVGLAGPLRLVQKTNRGAILAQVSNLIANEAQIIVFSKTLLIQLHTVGFNVLQHLLWLGEQS